MAECRADIGVFIANEAWIDELARNNMKSTGNRGLSPIVRAYWSGRYTLAQAGEHFGVSYATVNRAVKQAEERS